MKQSLKELTEEVKLIHHIVDIEWGREMRPGPVPEREMVGVLEDPVTVHPIIFIILR
jgi:hypothetical protein